MGRYTFRLPDIGEGIAEAEIVAWHVKPGDRVEEDGRLADMMTDKATVEMESPVAGTVLQVAGEVGDRVPIGSALVVIETEGEHADLTAAGPALAKAETVARTAPLAQTRHVGSTPDVRSSSEPIMRGKVLASPAVRARARALGIDLAAVHASEGPVIRHADLDALLLARAAPASAVPMREPEPGKSFVEVPGRAEPNKVIGLRRRIAENMSASKRHIPHFTYVEECDVTALESLRAELNAAGEGRPKLTLLPLLIRAICRALPQFPTINARYDDAAGVVWRYSSVHLGIATQTEAGLMVPVIREAQDLDPWQLADEISRLARAAREGTAKLDELSGSTLTITSLGPLGGIATAPVINRPEVAIIGPNRIVERPMFVADGDGRERVAKRKLMNLSIACDHRVVDGWDAASFVAAVKQSLESPLVLLA